MTKLLYPLPRTTTCRYVAFVVSILLVLLALDINKDFILNASSEPDARDLQETVTNMPTMHDNGIRDEENSTQAPTRSPSTSPTINQTLTTNPTVTPSAVPTRAPQIIGSGNPTLTPNVKSPTSVPSKTPTQTPIVSATGSPTKTPTSAPTKRPSSLSPSRSPLITLVPPKPPTSAPTSTVSAGGTVAIIAILIAVVGTGAFCWVRRKGRRGERESQRGIEMEDFGRPFRMQESGSGGAYESEEGGNVRSI